jgi:glutamate-1-semialdehyde 2,1-aminomutase
MTATTTGLIYDDYATLTPVRGHRRRICGGRAEELELYQKRTPKSAELFARAQKHMVKGVPCTWQADWFLPYTFYVDRAKGNRLWDVDGNEYIDFHFADTPAIFGHSPDNGHAASPTSPEPRRDVAGSTEDAIAVSEMLAERVGLPFWYVTLSRRTRTAWRSISRAASRSVRSC